ncbi:MAG: PqqD family protein [Acidobacteria bacterium]|nr:PqqD family protein [Acidobacteriota bacterium]
MDIQPLAIPATQLSVYRRSNAVVSRKISGETLVVPIRGKVGDLASIYSFNESGSVLWAALEKPRSLEELASVLCQSFDVEQGDAWRDADEFVQEMQAAGLLSAVES